METHIKSSEKPIKDLGNGVKRQILGYDSNVMQVKVYFEKDAIGALHQHVHQQVSYVLKGSFEVEINGKRELLTEGDAFVVPTNAMHGVTSLDEGVLLDTFSPMRDDFIK